MRPVSRETGVAAVEYAILILMIAGVVIVAVRFLGVSLSDVFVTFPEL